MNTDTSGPMMLGEGKATTTLELELVPAMGAIRSPEQTRSGQERRSIEGR